jgi:predicted metal-dependent peptidase
MWYAQDDNESNGGGSEQDNQKHTNSSNGDNENSEQDDSESKQSDSAATSANTSLSQEWKDISERMQQDLETFSKQQGDTAGNMMQNLREVNREKYDYTAFLKKFAVHTEVMKINDDEFDYIFYTYGLNLYKKMPLIEPLEYKDAKRIREFVIAIDTSGSTSGELVQKFVQKTYNVLKSTETFASKINLHIIQCDADIQEDVKITTQDEFDEYLNYDDAY